MSLHFSLFIDVDTGGPELRRIELFRYDVSANLIPMWQRAGCYAALYESDGQLAGSIVAPLQAALADMTLDAEAYRALNPRNSWDSYNSAMNFLQAVLIACSDNTKATISSWQ